MPISPTISDAEWEVMKILWASREPLLASDIITQLADRQRWSPRTIKTLLNRLVRKRALTFERQGKTYLYRPAVDQQHCVLKASESFLSRVFNGAAGPMLAHFVQHADLSPAEVQELQHMLQSRGKGARTPRTRRR